MLTLSPSGWRALAIITAIPVSITTMLCIYFMPESPRWLCAQNRSEEAMTIINAAALSNGFTMPRYRLVYEEEVHAKVNYWDLLSEKTRFITLPLWVVWMCFGFTYYGIILFTGRMYDKDGDDDGKPAPPHSA